MVNSELKLMTFSTKRFYRSFKIVILCPQNLSKEQVQNFMLFLTKKLKATITGVAIPCESNYDST